MTTRNRRRPSFRRGTGRRSRTSWEQLIFQHPHGLAAETVISDLTPQPMAADLLGTATIKRAIMSFNLFRDGDQVSTLVQQIAYSITLVTNDAFAAMAVPDPLFDFAQSWYYWNSQTHLFQAGGILGRQEAAAPIVHVDIRSQRRLRGGFKLVFISQTPVTQVDFTLGVSMRLLWTVD